MNSTFEPDDRAASDELVPTEIISDDTIPDDTIPDDTIPYDFGLDPLFYRRTLEGMSVPIIVVDRNGLVRFSNLAGQQLSGWAFEDGIGRHILDFIDPADHEWIAETFLTLVAMSDQPTIMGGELWNAIRFGLRTRDGSTIPVEINGKVALGDDAIDGIVLTIRDTRLENASQRILQGIAVGEEMDTLLGYLIEAVTVPPLGLSAAAYWASSRRDIELACSTTPALSTIPLGEDALGAAFPMAGPVTRLAAGDVPLVGADLTAAGFKEFLHVGVSAPESDVAVRLVAAGPNYVAPALSSVQRIQWAQEHLRVILLRDSTDRLLERAATVDPLTGLTNRRGLQQFLEGMQDDARCAVLFIDLDDFKAINDHHGHTVGDNALEIVGDRLRRSVRLDDLICRLGGDEFAVIVSEFDNHDPAVAATAVAARIVGALKEPLRVVDVTLQLSASVGIALPTAPLTVDQLINGADTAMYDAKRSGGGRYVIDGDRSRT